MPSIKSGKQKNWLFTLLLIAAIAVILFVFNIISDGVFLEKSNLKVIISHVVYPCFIAWGFCFLFACGYTGAVPPWQNLRCA